MCAVLLCYCHTVIPSGSKPPLPFRAMNLRDDAMTTPSLYRFYPHRSCAASIIVWRRRCPDPVTKSQATDLIPLFSCPLWTCVLSSLPTPDPQLKRQWFNSVWIFKAAIVGAFVLVVVFQDVFLSTANAFFTLTLILWFVPVVQLTRQIATFFCCTEKMALCVLCLVVGDSESQLTFFVLLGRSARTKGDEWPLPKTTRALFMGSTPRKHFGTVLFWLIIAKDCCLVASSSSKYSRKRLFTRERQAEVLWRIRQCAFNGFDTHSTQVLWPYLFRHKDAGLSLFKVPWDC